MKLTLIREPQNGNCTLGKIVRQLNSGMSATVCYTLELPYRDNKQNISCIPHGIFKCTPLANHKTSMGSFFSKCMRVHEVHGRAGILIHPGNFLKDTHGCILPGEEWDPKRQMIRRSRLAMSELFAFGEFELEIRTGA